MSNKKKKEQGEAVEKNPETAPPFALIIALLMGNGIILHVVSFWTSSFLSYLGIALVCLGLLLSLLFVDVDVDKKAASAIIKWVLVPFFYFQFVGISIFYGDLVVSFLVALGVSVPSHSDWIKILAYWPLYIIWPIILLLLLRWRHPIIEFLIAVAKRFYITWIFIALWRGLRRVGPWGVFGLFLVLSVVKPLIIYYIESSKTEVGAFDYFAFGLYGWHWKP